MPTPADERFKLDEVTLRLATREDQPSLRDLFVEGLIEGQIPGNDTGADIENLIDAYFADDGESSFWVAHHSDLVVGMIGVQKTEENRAEIRRLRVHNDYRRRGIGTRLMEQALMFCQHHGYLKIALDVRIEREGAIRLFEKFGFVMSRTRDADGRKILDFYLDLYRDPGETSLGI